MIIMLMMLVTVTVRPSVTRIVRLGSIHWTRMPTPVIVWPIYNLAVLNLPSQSWWLRRLDSDSQ